MTRDQDRSSGGPWSEDHEGGPSRRGPAELRHYAFAHVDLMGLAFQDPEGTVASLRHDGGRKLVAHLWAESGRARGLQVSAEAAAGAAPRAQSLRVGEYPAVIVELPRPTFPSGAYFVELVLCRIAFAGGAAVERSPVLLYYTLERTHAGANETGTMFCEWLDDGTHLNLGDGPPPDIQAFADVVSERVDHELHREELVPGPRVEWEGLGNGADEDARKRADELLQRLLDDPGFDAPRLVAELAQLGPPAAGHLVEALADASLEHYVVKVLGSFGASAVRELAKAVREAPPAVATRAAYALETMGPRAVGAEAALIAALDPDRDHHLRYRAARALGSIGARSDEAISALMAALEGPDTSVQGAAATSLGQVGSGHPEAVSALARALVDAGRAIRHSAAEGLSYLGAEAIEALPALVDELRTMDPDIGRYCYWHNNMAVLTPVSAAEAVAHMGRAAVPRLIQLLGDGDFRLWALLLLGMMGREARASVPHLIPFVSFDDPAVRSYAAEALSAVAVDSREAVETLIGGLADPAAEVRASAARGLGRLGASAAPAIPHLEVARRDPSQMVRWGAEASLEKIERAVEWEAASGGGPDRRD